MAGYNNYNGNGGYQNNQNNQQSRNYNLVQNWGLKVFNSRPAKNGTMLNCAFNGRKKQDGTYPKSMSVRVYIGPQTQCDFAPNTPLDGMNISVSGGFDIGDWTNQQGMVLNNFTIFANHVSIRQGRNNGGGYQQNGQNGGYNNAPRQGGYQQNGGYNNVPQDNNYGQQGGYNNAPQPQNNYQNAPRQGGYQQAQGPQQNGQNGSYNNGQNGGYNNGPQNNYNNAMPNDFPDFESFVADDGGVPF